MVSRVISIARSTACVLAFGAAAAGSAPPSTRLAGRVVDAADGRQPVRRAIVTLAGNPFPAGRSAITDDEGRFAFAHVPPGEFTLSATRPGFLKAAYGAARPGRPGTPIVVAPDRDVPDVTLAMSHGSAIDGVLRDTVGDPAPGMRVEAVRVTHGPAGDRGETAGVTLTDDRGEYRIFGLAPGDYVLVATPPAIVSGIGDIGAPSESEVDAFLSALQRRAGAPAPAPTLPGAPARPAHPPQKGYATPPTFYPGVVSSGEATRVSLGVNDDRENVDFAVRLSHSAAIDGTIMPVRGQAVPQVQISIHAAGPELPVFGGGAGGPSVSARPADRTFHISNVPPGRYRITARTFGAPGSTTAIISSGGALPSIDASAGAQWATADVDIAGDDLSGVTLTLQPALHVKGRLTFDTSTSRPPDPAAVRIALEPLADEEFGSNGLTAAIAATVGRDGSFEFPSVLPGLYRLTASAAGGGWWPRSARIETRDVLDGGLRVVASDVGGLALILSDRHTAIAGTLSGIGGRPATDYSVIAFPADRALWRAPSRRVASTRPTTAGTFELKDLPPGTYCLAVLTDVETTDLEDVSFLESVVPASLTVTVGEGERKIQNMRIGGA